jgi:nucleotide-binding universal stress UspA family protein
MKKTNAPGRSDSIGSSPFSKVLLHPHGMEWESGFPQQAAGSGPAARATIRTVLVPLDGSQQAEHALPHALAIARRSGATLRVVHVYSRLDYDEPWQWPAGLETDDRPRRGKRDYLRDVADRIGRTDPVRVETILVDGNDVKESLSTAASGTDLIVTASRRRGRLRRLFVPSMADQVRRCSTKPVLSVRGYAFPADLTGDPIARHILVLLDGSVLAEKIFEPATTLAGLEAARITLLNVQNREWTDGVFEHTSPSGYLVGAARKVEQAGSAVDAQIVTTNRSAPRAIVDYAERHKIDLIALATALDDGPLRFLRSNLVDSLVRRSDLPILALGVDGANKRAEVTTVVG